MITPCRLAVSPIAASLSVGVLRRRFVAADEDDLESVRIRGPFLIRERVAADAGDVFLAAVGRKCVELLVDLVEVARQVDVLADPAARAS